MAERSARPKLAPSLYLGLLVSFMAPLLTRIGIAKEHVVLFSRSNGDRNFQADLPFTPIYIGIGGLLTLATALLVFCGSFLRLFGDFLLAGIPATDLEMVARYPANSMRWVGGGAMTVAVAYSLIKFMGKKRVDSGEDVGDEALLVLDPAVKARLWLTIVIGVGIIFGWLVVQRGIDPFSLSMGPRSCSWPRSWSPWARSCRCRSAARPRPFPARSSCPRWSCAWSPCSSATSRSRT